MGITKMLKIIVKLNREAICDRIHSMGTWPRRRNYG